MANTNESSDTAAVAATTNTTTTASSPDYVPSVSPSTSDASSGTTNTSHPLLSHSQGLRDDEAIQGTMRRINESAPSMNPFRPRTEFGALEWFKLLVLGPILLPIRIPLFIFFLFVAALLAKIATMGLKKPPSRGDSGTPPPIPITGWRRKMLQGIRFCARALLFVSGYYWISVKGKRDRSAPILVGNHVGLFESLFMVYKVLPSFIAKKGSEKALFIGPVLEALQAVLVDRTSVTSRRDTKLALRDRAIAFREHPGEFNPVMIYPEGTTTNGNCLIGFKAGAFSPGVPVQPVCFRFPFVNADNSWVGTVTLATHVLKTLIQVVNYMEVIYLPTYYPNEKEKANPIQFGNAVRMKMAQALNVSVTEHTYADVLLHIAALRDHVTTNNSVLEMRKLGAEIQDITPEKLALLQKQFKAVDIHGRGAVTVDEFCQALHLPNVAVTRKLFELLDVDEDGTVSFKEWIVGLSLLSSKTTDEDAIRLGFSMFDIDGSGEIDRQQFYGMFHWAVPMVDDEAIGELFNKAVSYEKNPLRRNAIRFESFKQLMKENPYYLKLLLNWRSEYDRAKRTGGMIRPPAPAPTLSDTAPSTTNDVM